jgi:hypothetical protein
MPFGQAPTVVTEIYGDAIAGSHDAMPFGQAPTVVDVVLRTRRL